MIKIGARSVAALAALIVLLGAGAAWAFQQLPAGGQVNDDPAAGIDPTQSLSPANPANSDVTGGALTAGAVAVPWAVFQQTESGAADQVFSRSFATGAWKTRGIGTVGGKSSASPSFTGSLNFDQAQDGEVPSIDFAGAGRTVPWSTWYEHTVAFGLKEQIFASRFDNTGGANQDKWIFGGQSRGLGSGSIEVPSLNIRTNQDAENPVVAGGAAVAGNNPGPWVAWQETTSLPISGKDQIFVSKPIGPGTANCDTVTPLGVPDISTHIPAIGGFCFQQVGVPRVGPAGADPSLNIDTQRDGIEPDITFTGANDTVPWVVWYEKGTGTAGLNTNEMVFAAKAVSDATPGFGGFHWVAVGSQAQGALDLTNACGASSTAEGNCSLNKSATADAEDPSVAAGTMNPANATVPWVTWDETIAGVKQVFVSRLVGSGSTANFQLVNNGAAISVGANDSTRPDITFSGNTPYVSWHEDVGGGVTKDFLGHFVNAANPTFVLDESDVPLTPAAQADVRSPISSSCTANPFNSDGAACQGGAIGTPFFLFTNGTSPLGLFAGAYQPSLVRTGRPSRITDSRAIVRGFVNPAGASVAVAFQFGRTTTYGSNTTAQKTAPDDQTDTLTATLTGLTRAETFHYRTVVATDFGLVFGQDRTLVTTGGGAFNKKLKLLAHGHKVAASGPVTVCEPGQKLFLSITITQGRHSASGKWKKHTCSGKTGQWHFVVTVKGGNRFHKGKATGHATARVTQHGRQVRTRRWTTKVTLR